MMGVYNPKMAMPETCRDCGVMNCGHYDHGTWRIERHKYCPLIEVPDGHGRLVDVDELIVHDGWLAEAEGQRTHITFVCSNDLIDAPTVIPATERI